MGGHRCCGYYFICSPQTTLTILANFGLIFKVFSSKARFSVPADTVPLYQKSYSSFRRLFIPEGWWLPITSVANPPTPTSSFSKYKALTHARAGATVLRLCVLDFPTPGASTPAQQHSASGFLGWLGAPSQGGFPP